MITNEMWERVYADSFTVQDLLIKLLNETNDTAPEDSLTKLKHFIEEYKNLYKILWRIKANSILHEEKKSEEKES